MSEAAAQNQDPEYLNITGYAFFELKDPLSIRFPLRDLCQKLDLKGTILLSQEGVNSYLSGTPEALKVYKQHIHEELGFPPMDYKESWSNFQPYKRMLVKIKKEIITMGHPDIHPSQAKGTHLSPKEFKKWLDEKRDITVLDTRNDYEIEDGKFETAVDLNVGSFREFAERAKDMPQEKKNKPLVMYCTGGIRCEKAAPLFLKKYGFKEVYQLDGGILKYFEECGDAHYQGDCYVFDQRVGVDGRLKPSSSSS